jgi:hypothetical protein
MKDVLILMGSAVLIRLLILPCTLKTDRYFSVMSVLYRTLNKRIHTIAAKFADNRAKSYVEEISIIDRTVDQIQAYKKPLFFIIPIALQAAACLFVYAGFLHKRSDWQTSFLWLRDISAKDPYYLLPPIFLISLIIRHNIVIPHKMKCALAVPDLLLFLFSLNRSAAFNIFVICLMFLSATQSVIVKQRYKFPSIADMPPPLLPAKLGGRTTELLSTSDNRNSSVIEHFDLREWLHSFKKKTSIFLYDDVLMSLLIGILFGIGGLILYLMYWAYFHWQIKREWLV